MSESISQSDLSELEQELEQEFELESLGDEPSQEFELEIEGDNEIETFANRFYELSEKSYESELEENAAVYEILNDMEREFFWKKLKKRLKRAGKALIKKGLKLAPKVLGKVPGVGDVVKGVTQVATGNLNGALSTLARAGLKAGIQAALPGAGTAAVSAMNALGFEVAQPEKNKEAWRRYVLTSREAYDYLASNLNERADEPAEGSRLAMEAFNHALKQNAVGYKTSQQRPIRQVGEARKRKTAKIRLRRGQRLVIESE